MPRRIEQLSQADIKQLIAETYNVDASKVTLTIFAPYNGSPTDSSPGSVEASVELPPHERRPKQREPEGRELFRRGTGATRTIALCPCGSGMEDNGRGGCFRCDR